MNIEEAKTVLCRYYESCMRNTDEIAAPELAKKLILTRTAGLEYEVFVVLFLDAQQRLIHFEEMFRGTLTQTCVYPREVVKAALRANAAAVILGHNHPSGVAEPSRADEHLTSTLKAALALVDVRVMDHIIAGSGRATSMAERGLL